jgi:hypothetical protein
VEKPLQIATTVREGKRVATNDARGEREVGYVIKQAAEVCPSVAGITQPSSSDDERPWHVIGTALNPKNLVG